MARKLFSWISSSVLITVSMAHCQVANRITQPMDELQTVELRGHVPSWAKPDRQLGRLAPDTQISSLQLFFQRTPEQQAAWEKLQRDQQTPGSPNFHHWLTAEEIADRFGLSEHDVAAITLWLSSHGLKVNHVAHSRQWLVFSGTSGNLEQAFHVAFRRYKFGEDSRIAISSEPRVPVALAPVLDVVVGLTEEHSVPQHYSHTWSKEAVGRDGVQLMPTDFETIYDIPFGPNAPSGGAGQTIAIIGRASVAEDDINSFSTATGTADIYSRLTNGLRLVPTADGGVKPAGPITSPPPSGGCGKGTECDDQVEATLDVTRAGSIAYAANLQLIYSASSSTVDGVDIATEYAIESQSSLGFSILNISFGGCELGESAFVDAWQTLADSAATEGVSIFVSAGDSGAAQICGIGDWSQDLAINDWCSPNSVTCVGGTEFTGDAISEYTGRSPNVTGYITEGAWNDSYYGDAYQLASGGGGLSTIITKSWWQSNVVGTSSKYRTVPDVSFTASADHDGYFLCMAAISLICPNPSGVEGGTSASAPDMAGIMALIDEQQGEAQGNPNPSLYSIFVFAPDVFHDVTISSSGVSHCQVSAPSLCDNTTPSENAASGGIKGYAVGTGYDMVTGLGSLDVTKLLSFWAAAGNPGMSATTVTSPTLTTTYGNNLQLIARIFTFGPVSATGNVTFMSGNLVVGSAPVVNAAATLNMTVPRSIAVGTYPVTAVYSGDKNYSGSKSAALNINVQQPTVTTLTASDITPIQGSTVTITAAVRQLYGTGIPTGHVTFSEGGTTLATVALNSSGAAMLTAPTLGVPTANYKVTATYGGDSLDYSSSGELIVSVSSVQYLNLGDEGSGLVPRGSLTQGSDGDFYGTTAGGGYFYGAVFSLSQGGNFSILHSFCPQGNAGCPDGNIPAGNLLQSEDGNFYGMTSGGNSDNQGVVYKISAGGSFTTVYSFCAQSGCPDGSAPYGGLVEGTDGNFYGTTSGGGGANSGTVFKLTPGGVFTTLYSFCPVTNCLDGSTPTASLIQASDGNFYGVTVNGGANGKGTLFQLTPSGSYNVLYSFCQMSGCADGANPYASVIQGTDGNLYSTTISGGANGDGEIWKSTLSGQLTVIYSFCAQSNCADGYNTGAAWVGLVQASDGDFYGTTNSGGNGGGTLFQLSPSGSYSVLYSFCPPATGCDGSGPIAPMLQAADGSFYGSTYGASYDGALFHLALSPALASPIQLSPSAGTLAPGALFNLTYKVLNAVSDTFQRCFATNNAGDTMWVGIKPGKTTDQVISLFAPSAGGTYIYSLTCGGLQSGFATVIVN